MGLPGQVTHPDVAKAYETAAAACKKHGKWLGMGGVYVEEGMSKYVGLGARLILGGNDLPLADPGGVGAVAVPPQVPVGRSGCR